MIKRLLQRRNFCTKTIPTPQASAGIISLKDIGREIKQKERKIAEETDKLGISLTIPNEEQTTILNTGVFENYYDHFSSSKDVSNAVGVISGRHDAFDRKGYNYSSKNSLLLKYLSNMGLLSEYSNIFRDFLQSIARNDDNYLDLVAEPKLADYINSHLDKIRKRGYQIELENLTINQEFESVRWQVYKNLRVRREDNTVPFKLNPNHANRTFNIAKFINSDYTWFDNTRPFILSTELKVITPMKLVVYNQNFSKKILDQQKEADEKMQYIVKFETQLGLSDFFWILPTKNKPDRTRQTRIVDFNNVLNGNPFDAPKEDKENLKTNKI